MKGDLNKDGKMSSYETNRSNAIQKAMGKKGQCGPGTRYDAVLKRCVSTKRKRTKLERSKGLQAKSRGSSRLRNIKSGKIKQRIM